MASWPSAQDYNEAVQMPEVFFDDPELTTSTPELNNMGLPRAISGNFASVYKMLRGEKPIAVKCFLRNIHNQHLHYQELSLALCRLACVIDFKYLLKGIMNDDNWYPIVKMGWLEGHTLEQFLSKNLHNKTELDRFIAQFTAVMRELQQHGIAHGDLQHGNLIVRKGDVMLVDYDGMFVPSMKGQSSRELGHSNYQHPARNTSHFDAGIDNFSAWIIYHTVMLLRSDPGLWQRNGGGEDCLLFRHSDFLQPESSRLMSELERHPVPDIKERAKVLRNLFEYSFETVPKFDPSQDQSKSSFSSVSIARNMSEDVPYPSIEDYMRALKDHPQALTDATLQKGVQELPPIIKRNGITLKLSCFDKSYAVKCFLKHDPDRKMRFESIAKHNMGPAARHLLSFQYQSKGIEVNGRHYPVLRMTWFPGVRLDARVKELLRDSSKGALHELVENFREMMNALTLSGIAHGDLEPSNILVDGSGKMRLIDYDSMYVPALAGLTCSELGTPPFAHPSRKHDHFGPFLDNYSAAVIDSVLTYLAAAPPGTNLEWRSLLQESATNAALMRGPSDHARTQLNKMIKQLRKYRIDQVPALKANHVI
jgi:tRNA A-37 threonylcarbamoyl transferase component Bud32